MSDSSAGDIGGIFAGCVALLATVGGAFRWIVGWKERREEDRSRKLDTWERELQKRDDLYEQRNRKYLSLLTRAHLQLRKEHVALRGAYDEVFQRLHAIEPDDPVLQKVDRDLKLAFVADPTLPDDLLALLMEIEPAADTRSAA